MERAVRRGPRRAARVTQLGGLCCFEDRGLRRSLVNFDQIASSLVTHLHREASAEGSDGAARRLLSRVLAYPDLPKKLHQLDPAAQLDLMIPVHLRRNGVECRFFTTLTTLTPLGTPLDITLDELRIESYYPADDVTARWLRL